MTGFPSYVTHPTSHRSAGSLALSSVLLSLSLKTAPLLPLGPPLMPLPMSVALCPRPRLCFCPPPKVILCSWSLDLCPAWPQLTNPAQARRVYGPVPLPQSRTLPSSTFSTLNPSQQSPGSSQAPGTGGGGLQWGAPAAVVAPPIGRTRPMGARRRNFRCPEEGGGSGLLWCGALGGRRPGGPGAAAGLRAQPSGCRGGARRTRCGVRAPRVRGRAPRGEAAPPRGSCPAASLPRS